MGGFYSFLRRAFKLFIKFGRNVYRWCVKIKCKIRTSRDKRREVNYGNLLIWSYRDELYEKLSKTFNYKLMWSRKEVMKEIDRLSKIIIHDYIGRSLC